MNRYKFPPPFCLVLVLAVSAVIAFLSLKLQHSWGDDFAQYIGQARSIVEGTTAGYLAANAFNMGNSTFPMAPDLYPWGFPLLLAPVYFFAGLDMFAFKVYGIVWFMLMLVAVYLLTRRRLEGWYSLLLVMVFAFNPALMDYLDSVLSDFPFLAMTLLALYLIDRHVARKDYVANRYVGLALTGALIFMAYFIRSAGIVLLPVLLAGQVVSHLLDRQLRTDRPPASEVLAGAAINLIPFAVFAALFVLSRKMLPSGGGTGFYFERFSYTGISVEHIFDQFLYNLWLPARFFGKGYFSRFLYITTLLPFFVGVVRYWRRDYVLTFFLAFYLLMLAVWPDRQGLRYALPELPVYLYFVFKGLLDLTFSVRVRIARYRGSVQVFRVFAFFLPFLFFCQSTSTAVENVRSGRVIEGGPYAPESVEMFEYIRNGTEPDAVIVFVKQRLGYLMTERRFVMISEAEALDPAMHDYLILFKDKGGEFQVHPEDPRLDDPRLGLAKTFENERFVAYRFGAAGE